MASEPDLWWFVFPHVMLKPFDTGDQKNERCGVLYGSIKSKRGDHGHPDSYTHLVFVSQVQEVPNRHEHPRDHCKILRSDVEALPATRHPVIGYLHTHTGLPSHPSMGDLHSTSEDQIGVVYSPRLGKIVYYNNQGFIKEEQVTCNS